MKHIKLFESSSKIKFVADLSDPYTKAQCKLKWNSWDEDQRKEFLKGTTYSLKYVDLSFDDLTPAIQSIIITA